MQQSTSKGLFHLALAVLGAAEALTAKGTMRKLLCSAMTGFHAYATYYHFVREGSQDSEIMREYNG